MCACDGSHGAASTRSDIGTCEGGLDLRCISTSRVVEARAAIACEERGGSGFEAVDLTQAMCKVARVGDGKRNDRAVLDPLCRHGRVLGHAPRDHVTDVVEHAPVAVP